MFFNELKNSPSGTTIPEFPGISSVMNATGQSNWSSNQNAFHIPLGKNEVKKVTLTVKNVEAGEYTFEVLNKNSGSSTVSNSVQVNGVTETFPADNYAWKMRTVNYPRDGGDMVIDMTYTNGNSSGSSYIGLMRITQVG